MSHASSGSSTVVLQVTDDDLQNPELLAEMQALMGGDPTPAPKPATAQELTAQFNRCRQRAVGLKKQGKLSEARKAVCVFAYAYCFPADSSVHMHTHPNVFARIPRCLR